jgi:hypothetical protein
MAAAANNPFQLPQRWEYSHLAHLDIIRDICYFVQENCAKMAFLADQNGGWEAWLQAELAFNFSLVTHYQPTRELAVYNDQRQRIDLWCRPSHNTRLNTQPSREWGSIGIELKCEGMWQDTMRETQQTPAIFHQRVMDDVTKVSRDINTAVTGPCTVYVVAITTNKKDVEENFKFQRATAGVRLPQFNYWQSPAAGTLTTPAFYVLWWSTRFGFGF